MSEEFPYMLPTPTEIHHPGPKLNTSSSSEDEDGYARPKNVRRWVVDTEGKLESLSVSERVGVQNKCTYLTYARMRYTHADLNTRTSSMVPSQG